MKAIFILLMMFVLTACDVKYSNDELNKQIEQTLSINFQNKVNVNQEYLSFYLPSDMSLLERLQENNILEYMSDKIMMNLNIAGIVSDRYWYEERMNDDGFIDQNKLIYSYSGEYQDLDLNTSPFVLNIYKFDEQYIVSLISVNTKYYAFCEEAKVIDMARHILTVARSCVVKQEEIISTYSRRSQLELSSKEIEIFEKVIPINGNLSDIIGE